MGYYLFDSLVIGITLAAILEFLSLVTWMFMRERFNKLYLLIGPGVIGLFVLLDWLVETNREEIENTTRVIVQAAEDEDAAAIIALVSDNFLYRNRLGKTKAAGFIKSYLIRPVIVTNIVRNLIVKQVSQVQGQVEFSVITNFEPEGTYGMVPLLKTRWQFDFVRDPDGQYRLSNLELLEPDGDIFSSQILR
ncbi:hypothetical protein ACFL02_03920 [Planctomycetota bacterium]